MYKENNISNRIKNKNKVEIKKYVRIEKKGQSTFKFINVYIILTRLTERKIIQTIKVEYTRISTFYNLSYVKKKKKLLCIFTLLYLFFHRATDLVISNLFNGN